MPRYVILRHSMPPDGARSSHYDLMLEGDGTLRTWALDSLPTGDAEIAAEALPDHRIAYLDYEGPVSGNRGRVERIERGTYRAVEEGGLRVVIELADEAGTRKRLVLRREDAQRWRVTGSPA